MYQKTKDGRSIKIFTMKLFFVMVILQSILVVGIYPVKASSLSNSYHQTDFVIRLVNTGTGERIYTMDLSEGVFLSEHGWMQESYSWIACKEYGTPIYRLYNASIDDHLFTSDENEVKELTKKGWEVDFGGKPLFYSLGQIPIYRVYSQKDKRHILTSDKKECEEFIAQGLDDEGITFYGIDLFYIDEPPVGGISFYGSLPCCNDEGIDVNKIQY